MQVSEHNGHRSPESILYIHHYVAQHFVGQTHGLVIVKPLSVWRFLDEQTLI